MVEQPVSEEDDQQKKAVADRVKGDRRTGLLLLRRSVFRNFFFCEESGEGCIVGGFEPTGPGGQEIVGDGIAEDVPAVDRQVDIVRHGQAAVDQVQKALGSAQGFKGVEIPQTVLTRHGELVGAHLRNRREEPHGAAVLVHSRARANQEDVCLWPGGPDIGDDPVDAREMALDGIAVPTGFVFPEMPDEEVGLPVSDLPAESCNPDVWKIMEQMPCG